MTTAVSSPPLPAPVPPTRGRIPWPLLVLLGVAGTAISVTGSWIPSFWGDEAASIMSAERSWASLWPMLGTVDAVHGLYYAFLHVWIDLFGASPFSVRLPSALAVGLATASLAVLGARLSRPAVGITAAALFATLPRTTYYGMETRAYAFTMVLVIWLLLLLISLVARRETRVLPWLGFAALFAVANILFIYTVLFALVFAAIGLLMRPGAATAWRGALWIGAGALVSLPVLVFAYLEREQIAFLHSRNGFTAKALFETPWFTNTLLAWIGWSAILIGLLLGVITRVRLRRGLAVRPGLAAVFAPRSEGGAALPTVLSVGVIWLVVPSLLLAAGTLITPLYSPRYLAFTAPAVALLMAVGVVALAQALRAAWLAPLLTLAMIAATIPVYLDQRTPFPRNGGTDWNAIADTMDRRAQPGDAVIFDSTPINARKPRLALHLYPEAFAGLEDVGLRTRFDLTDGLWDRSYGLDDTIARLDGATTVWFVQASEKFSTDPERSAEYLPALEAAGYTVVDSVRHNQSEIFELRLGG
ncbi:glycosyltransferase family 39 protein [Mycetocola spongiae]|uniref:glycosyltransferase family 39 protein n=1 Tax=Mycetocola spongiae TaxID=2859226 RepID=UPI001CF15DB1|nr:glycosyltransferase family 39 protein [Mycetocola spongiae]UCR88969.1 glycosyltransferase family 39 protein [Mycetocola spongiae]